MRHVFKVLLLSCAGTSLALAQGAVEGEKWRITSKMQMAGMSMPGMSSEVCKQPGEDSVPIKTEDNCQVYDIARNGNVQSFKMRCTGKDAMEGSAQFTYLGADRYQGKMTINAQGETMNMEYEGQKLGKCDGGEMNLQAKQMQAQAQQQMATQEKLMVEHCHKTAAEATSPQLMQTLCKDPADVRTFCSATEAHDKFQDFAEQEKQATAQGHNVPEARPLSESARLCGFSVDARRDQLCTSAEQNGKLGFIASQCPVQGAALAQTHCAGRSYTSISNQYRNFCATFANSQTAAQDESAVGKTKGLFNKGKKALGGIFSN
jgi:hypothetical protein